MTGGGYRTDSLLRMSTCIEPILSIFFRGFPIFSFFGSLSMFFFVYLCFLLLLECILFFSFSGVYLWYAQAPLICTSSFSKIHYPWDFRFSRWHLRCEPLQVFLCIYVWVRVYTCIQVLPAGWIPVPLETGMRFVGPQGQLVSTVDQVLNDTATTIPS